MNIPNALTTLRFFLVPVFVYYFFSNVEGNLIIAASIFLFAGITDIMDGYIARKYNMITKWGKLMDPLADKSMQLTAIICLAIQDLVPMWAIYIIALKEILMVLGSITLYKKKVVVSASWYGKAATVLFYLAILAIILFKDQLDYFQRAFFMGIAVGSALFAFVRYSMNYRELSESVKVT